MAGIFSFISVILTLTAVFQGSEAQSNFSLDYDRCSFESGFFSIVGWARPGSVPSLFPPQEMETKTIITATMVTIVDRVLNSTTVTTSLPPGWTPPPTNAAGTQTHVINVGESSVTLTFPNVYVRWPTEYTICPQGYCDGVTPAITTTINSLPSQPTETFFVDNRDDDFDLALLEDPKGILAIPVFIGGSHPFQPACSELLGPYNPVFKCDSARGGGPVWGGLDSKWMKVVTSTKYLDADPSSGSGSG